MTVSHFSYFKSPIPLTMILPFQSAAPARRSEIAAHALVEVDGSKPRGQQFALIIGTPECE